MTYLGQMKGGVVVLEGGTSLPDGMQVRVEPLNEPPVASSLAEQLTDWAGKGTGLPEDLAENHDHYLRTRT